MPLHSARIGSIEARDRLGAKQAARMELKNDREGSSAPKRSTKKTSPSLVKVLARKLQGREASNDSAESAKRDVDKIGDAHDSENVRDTPSAKEYQQTQKWLYDVQDLDAWEVDTDVDSVASPSDSERTLAPGINDSRSTQEQGRQTQMEMNNIEDASRMEWRGEVDSIASTLAEEGQPMRKLLKWSCYDIRKTLMLPGVP